MSTSAWPPRRAVLLALDGSPAAATAAPAARLLASQLDAILRVLHVAPDDAPADVLRERLQLERCHLEGCDVHIHRGSPAPGILEMVDDPATVMTVLTTHGRAIEPGRHLGTVAEAVVAGTARPILLIRPEVAAEATAALRLRRLLLPLDGTPATLHALGAVAELACRLDASFDLLFVSPPNGAATTAAVAPGTIGVPRYLDQLQHELAAWGQEVVERLGASCGRHPLGMPVYVFVARGTIEDEIVRFAEEHREDVVVLVRCSKLEPGRARVLRAVLEHTPCPVLLTGATWRCDIGRCEGRSWRLPSSVAQPCPDASLSIAGRSGKPVADCIGATRRAALDWRSERRTWPTAVPTPTGRCMTCVTEWT
jgi:nucleotide-binding universal stress UspA family protein